MLQLEARPQASRLWVYASPVLALAITVLTLTELAGPSLTQLALRQAGEASD